MSASLWIAPRRRSHLSPREPELTGWQRRRDRALSDNLATETNGESILHPSCWPVTPRLLDRLHKLVSAISERPRRRRGRRLLSRAVGARRESAVKRGGVCCSGRKLGVNLGAAVALSGSQALRGPHRNGRV